MTTKLTPKFAVKEIIKTDNPADEGPTLATFLNWEDAKEYQETLYTENNQKTYISELK